MSLLFFDGFDGYDASTDLTNFGGWNASTSNAISSTVRVGTGKSLSINYNTTGQLQQNLSADQSAKTVYIGFAFCRNVIPASAQIFRIADSAIATQVTLYINSSFLLGAKNSAGTILATGTTTLAKDSWYYIELKVLVANSGGVFDCRINGASEFTFSGDTQSQATASVKYIAWDNLGSMNSYLLDDIYVLNSDGTLNNTYLGEVLCKHLPLIGDTTAGFTRNTGASNYLAVDDLIGSPDDATTYVSTTTTGTRDEYTLTNTSGTNAIFGVKVNTRVQKDAANPKSFKHGIKTGANQQDATVSLGIGYSNYQNIYESSDGAGTAWTSGTLDSAVSTIEVV